MRPDDVPKPKEGIGGNLETKTFSTDFIASRIKILLESNEQIKRVAHIQVVGKGTKITLDIGVSAGPMGSDIGIKAILGNKGSAILVEDFRIDASFLIRGTVEKMIAQKIGEVSGILKEYIEKEEKRKVKKMEIENGVLKVTFASPESVPEPESVTPSATPVVESKPMTREQKAQAITVLRETVASAQRVIREEGERMEKRRERREALLGELELVKDKIKNPFKYFIIDKLYEINFRVLFMQNKENVLLSEINYIMGEDGRELQFWNPRQIVDRGDNAVHFSSNGFYLRLTNKDEVRGKGSDGKEVIIIDSPEAKYDLVAPDGRIIQSKLNYQTANELYYAKTRMYQAEQLNLFAKLKSTFS